MVPVCPAHVHALHNRQSWQAHSFTAVFALSLHLPQAGQLKVRFPFAPVFAPYDIIRLDGLAATGYSKAVVYSCVRGQVRRQAHELLHFLLAW